MGNRKRRLTVVQKKAILNDYDTGVVVNQIMETHSVARSTVYNIVNNRDSHHDS